MLTKAVAIAVDVHEGQRDKGGQSYIMHPIRVMLACETTYEKICGVLHDVVEDSNVTLKDLEAAGFPAEIIKALDCLTRRSSESYDEFIDRVLTNELAVRVKLADINDNMDLSRLKCVTQQDLDRCKKYQNAMTRIVNHLKRNNINL